MEVLGLVDVPVWLLLTLLLVLTLYWYSTRDYGYFRTIGIPGPKPLPFFGNLSNMFGERGIPSIDLNLKKKYGKVVGSFLMGARYIIVFDEDMISEITLKRFDNFTNRNAHTNGSDLFDQNLAIMKDHTWKRARKAITPAFTPVRLRKMAHEINRCAKQLTSNLASVNDFEAMETNKRFTIDVIVSTAFGVRINSQEERDNDLVKHSNGLVDLVQNNTTQDKLQAVFPKLAKYLGWIFGNKKQAEKRINVARFFRGFLANMVEGHQSGTNKGKDNFVELMVNARNDNEGVTDKDNIDASSQVKSATRGLSSMEIMSNALLFYLAGFDTTSGALRFLMYELARNPECQEKLIEEIERVVGNEEDVTYDMVSEMTYLDMCLCESLRMYPPIPTIDRKVKETVTINKVLFEKGTVVMIPISAMQQDPDIWPQPEKFDPQRFEPEEKAKRSPFHWMPFGYGQRSCIGGRMAMFEIKVAMVHVLREHKLIKCAKTEDPLVLLKSRYLTNEAGMWLKLEKRK